MWRDASVEDFQDLQEEGFQSEDDSEGCVHVLDVYVLYVSLNVCMFMQVHVDVFMQVHVDVGACCIHD